MTTRLLIVGLLIWAGTGRAQTNSTPVAANDLKLTFTRGPAAPTGAAGVAELTNLLRQRSGPASLRVEIENLPPGNYDLRAVRSSAALPDFLAAITIPDPAAIPSGTAGPSSKENSTTHSAEVLRTKVQTTVPLDLPAGDLERIVLSDPGGNTLLEARLPMN